MHEHESAFLQTQRLVIDVAVFLEAIDVSLEAAVNIFDLGLFESLRKKKEVSQSQEREENKAGRE